MGFAYFEKVNRVGNSFKYYKYEIAPDLFYSRCLSATWGRMGQTSQNRKLASGSDEVLWRFVLEHARSRFDHGYVLLEFDGPSHVRIALERIWAAGPSEGKELYSGDRGESARNKEVYFFILKLKNLLGWEPGVIESLANRYDPTGEAGQSASNTDQLCLFDEMIDANDADNISIENRREIVRVLAQMLLKDDPHGLTAVRHGLTAPRQLDGKNLVHLFPRRRDSLFSMSLHRLFYGDTDLHDVTAKLAADGIRTLGQLIQTDKEILRTHYGIDRSQLNKIEMKCGEFGLWLGMTQLKFGNVN